MYRADGRCANLAHFEAPVFVGPCVVDVVGAAVVVVVVGLAASVVGACVVVVGVVAAVVALVVEGALDVCPI